MSVPPPPPPPSWCNDLCVRWQAPVLQGMGFKCGSVNADVQAAQQLLVRAAAAAACMLLSLSLLLQERLQPQRLPTLYVLLNGKKISEIEGGYPWHW